MIFTEVWPRTPARDMYLLDSLDGAAPLFIILAVLYLGTGRYVPPEAKRCKSADFGFCDAEGNPVIDQTAATHIGWTVNAQ